ncbi:hypothetical protein UFOVP28_66 [uncultured Caudovirales phage]|uniref:Uncharacterized protein n=1 Tax=uncultured Caudovirales phage TaxID=2100421 RepID=A0A6J5KNF8_9CAUD|nr:hypothetical protein UFOVP28_66 [uncultured Caudovirales phage]
MTATPPENDLFKTIEAILNSTNMMRAQREATRTRTSEEAMTISATAVEAAKDVFGRDQNLQYLLFTTTPYGTSDEGAELNGSIGFSSQVSTSLSTNAMEVFCEHHIPIFAREMAPKWWNRVSLAWHVLLGRCRTLQKGETMKSSRRPMTLPGAGGPRVIALDPDTVRKLLKR